MASMVDLGMYNLIVGDCRLIEVGPALGTISCEDPQNRMCLVLHMVDSPLDEFA